MLLKLIAWTQRRYTQPKKDAADMAYLLRHFSAVLTEKVLFDQHLNAIEAASYDIDLAGCRVLGQKTNPSLAQRLDSRDCQACHDGVLAHDIGKSHPIGVDYRLAQLKSKGKLRDMSLLVPPLQFENGRIGCLTCHAPDSPLPGHLVISNGGSRLCLLCHAL